MMKKGEIFIVTLLAGVLLFPLFLLGFFYVVGSCVQTNGDAAWCANHYGVKKQLVERIASPRLIVLSGSNSLYSIDSDMLTRKLGRETFNFGLYGGIPLRFYPRIIRNIARPGDVFVLPLETHYYGNVFPVNPVVVAMLHESGFRHFQADLSKKERFELYVYYSVKWLENSIVDFFSHPGQMKYLFLSREKENFRDWNNRRELLKDNPRYNSFLWLTPRGDIPVDRSPLQKFSPVDYFLPLSEEFLKNWEEIQRVASEKKCTVHLTWPVLNGLNGSENLVKALAARKIPIVGSPSGAYVPPECLFDTNYHVNVKGRKLRSEWLCRELKKVLVKPQ